MAYTTSTTLLKKIAGGDEIGWQEFYFRYAPFVRKIAQRLDFPPCEVDELLQQTMVKIFTNGTIARFDRAKGHFHSYLYTIIKNKIIDIVRRRRESSLPDEISFEEIPAEDKFGEFFDVSYRQYLLDLAFDALKEEVHPTTFEAFCLLVRNEFTPRQVAGMLDISLASVYAAKSRCTRKITRILREIGENDPDFTV